MLRGRAFCLEIDGVDIGKLRPAGSITTKLDDGEHRVRVRVGNECSKVVTVLADATGSASLVARPADLDPDSRGQRLARRDDPFALTLTESDDASSAGPTFWQLYRSRPPSFTNPARTRPQKALRLLGLTLAVIGFVLLPLVRNGIGLVLLFAAALIFGWQLIGHLRWTRRT